MPAGAISPSPHPCHPERSLTMSEANRQTQSKAPCHRDTTRGNARNFRIVIRFSKENQTEQLPISSREAAAWGSPARQCGVSERDGASPVGSAQLHESAGITK